MKILQKIIKAIRPISREEFDLYTASVTDVLKGMTVTANQQAQILTTMSQQLMVLHKARKPEQEQENKEVDDPSFQ